MEEPGSRVTVRGSCGVSEPSAIAVKGGHLFRKALVPGGDRRVPAPSFGGWAGDGEPGIHHPEVSQSLWPEVKRFVCIIMTI